MLNMKYFFFLIDCGDKYVYECILLKLLFFNEC